ncbi:MAG TPA: holo-[acyl-carrier-protein] synthase [Moorella mulderi]|nr:holo-[acyl-carrier-protein] synthase [Moorella mulderi]
MKGIGIDIIEIARVERALKRHPRLLHRIFTLEEIDYCRKKKRPGASLAARFAAKEAVMKSLGLGLYSCSFQEIEILGDGQGQPQVRLQGRAQIRAERLGVERVIVSLSHCRSYAVAVAWAWAEGL